MKLLKIGNEIVNLDHVTKVKRENTQTVIYLTAMGGAEIANCVHVKGPPAEKVWKFFCSVIDLDLSV